MKNFISTRNLLIVPKNERKRKICFSKRLIPVLPLEASYWNTERGFKENQILLLEQKERNYPHLYFIVNRKEGLHIIHIVSHHITSHSHRRWFHMKKVK